MIRLEQRELKGSALKPFLVKNKTVRIPAQDLYRLPVPGKEDEDRAAERWHLQLLAYESVQSVDAKVHIDIALADIVLHTFA